MPGAVPAGPEISSQNLEFPLPYRNSGSHATVRAARNGARSRECAVRHLSKQGANPGLRQRGRGWVFSQCFSPKTSARPTARRSSIALRSRSASTVLPISGSSASALAASSPSFPDSMPAWAWKWMASASSAPTRSFHPPRKMSSNFSSNSSRKVRSRLCCTSCKSAISS